MDKMQKKERLIQAWKEVLGVSAANDSDNFFEAGGDSTKGMQLVGKLAQQGLKLDMLKLYTEPTIAQLAEQLEEVPADFKGKMSGGRPLFAPNPAPTAQVPPMGVPIPPMGAPMPMYMPMYVLVPVYMPQPMMAPQPMAVPQSMGVPPMAAPQPMGAPQPMAAPPLGPVTKSPEDALDGVLSEIFPQGYDRQVNLFEQGLDSMKMMQIVFGCGKQGYRVDVQEMMKEPTFAGIVACMKTA